MKSASAWYPLVGSLRVSSHSSLRSSVPSHQKVLATGPLTWAHAARRASTAPRASSTASARESVVVCTCRKRLLTWESPASADSSSPDMASDATPPTPWHPAPRRPRLLARRPVARDDRGCTRGRHQRDRRHVLLCGEPGRLPRPRHPP